MARLYMKGGNAFKCIINPNGADATRNGGGTSDWDTQAIVTPWAPLPLQAITYSLVEELVTDALIKAGAEKEAALIRVADDVTLDALATLLKSQLLKRSQGQATVRERVHSTPRATGFTREVTLVAFQGGKARSYVSLTTATDAELPFRPDPENPNCLVAPMTAIATQRKIAAALIEDYQISTEISRQYEALKNLLPVI